MCLKTHCNNIFSEWVQPLVHLAWPFADNSDSRGATNYLYPGICAEPYNNLPSKLYNYANVRGMQMPTHEAKNLHERR